MWDRCSQAIDGGLDMAVEQLFDARTVWVCDNDPAATKVLARRYPGVPNLGDITKIDWTRVEPVDILTGGFPCQDVSHAGRRPGLRPGTRTGLWQHMAYAIDQLRPRYVVAENVRGLLSAYADSDMEPCPWCLGDRPDDALRACGAVLGDLADLRMDARWCGLRAADIGAPHGRFRVFILATAADTGHGEPGEPAVRPVRPQPRHRRPDAANPERLRRREGRQPAPGQAGGGRPPDLSVRPDRTPVDLLPTPGANDAESSIAHKGGNPTLYGAAMLLPTPSAADGLGGHERRGGDRGDELLLAGAAKQLLPTFLIPESACRCSAWGQYQPAIHRWELILDRTAPPPTANGRLSPIAVEFMMGLPDGWVTAVPGLTRAQQLKILGNGVVVQQCVAALTRLLDQLQVTR